MTLVDEEAMALAEQAMQAMRYSVDAAVEEIINQPRHVLLYFEGQEDLAHLTLQGVDKNLVDDVGLSNPSLDNIIVLDSTEEGWADVSPALDITGEKALKPGMLHQSQSILVFGSNFLTHSLVQPVARTATRFYAALQDGPGVESLIRSVHPMREVVVL
jgi:hypothetical protein